MAITRKDAANARKLLADYRKQERQARGQRVSHKPARQVRERDHSYLSWLHEDLPCIACLVLGETLPRELNPIEAAHQKLNAPSRNVQKRMGVRPDDVWTVPLCRHHHRIGPLCCDPAQAKFWSIVGLSPEETADFCLALYGAFRGGSDGKPVVWDYAGLAASNRLINRDAAA